MNTFKTALLFVVLTLLLIFIGYLIGGRNGVTFAFIMALIMNMGAYWFSGKIVLAAYRAKEIKEGDNPRLFGIVRSACQMASLPIPRVYIIPTESPNAFATCRNPEHAAVAATIAGAISYIAFMARWMPFFGGGDDDDRGGNFIILLLVGILAPIAAAMVQMAISRQREYMADRASAEISHKPLALASALKKLHDRSRKIPLKANPASAHLFIVNPLTKKDMTALFSTHPPLEERIACLENYAREGL